MRTERVLAILGFVLALVGGVLLLRMGIFFDLSVPGVLSAIPPLILGILAIGGGFLIWAARPVPGGLLCIVAGLGALLLDLGLAEAVVLFLAGVLGLLSAAK